MKLSHKLMMVSAAVLMGVSPVLGMASSSVQAAPVAHAKGVNNTYGKNSRVEMTKTMKFVDRNGKKTSKTATKGGKYTIWNVKTINGQVYYSIQTDLKYWIPASATQGTVTYKSGNTTYTLKSDGKKVTTTTSTAKKSTAKKTTKTTKSDTSSKKTTKTTKSDTSSKKTSTKTSTKSNSNSKTTKTTTKSTSTKKTTSKKAAVKPVKITMKNKAYVYDKNGKRVNNYLNTKYIGKGVTVKGLGTKTIKGVKYYALQPNRYYVKASDVTVK
ncbi:SLAP domain-containing protein [Lactobacillus amylovorus]|uniref:SLAP domain-containing protein n=1 Tax=Lactobacillus amylovorus TaxID=1604 RepID=UPI00232BBF77|nr:SLAP domain-containing protein [Lactobacillus amylovorus]MDB6228738.1 SLAP domain-containing protein [Lactobacillus amylovorus]